MARIPEAQTIQRKVVQIAPDVARYNAGIAGSGLVSMGKAVGEWERVATDHQVSKAAADFLVAKTEQDNAYDQDDDYATIEERYSGAVNEKLGAVAENISNPRVRAQFVERHRPMIAAGQERIANIAWGKEVDSERAEMQERIDAMQNAAWTGSDDDMAEANATAMQMFQSAQSMGYIDERDRVELTKKFKTDLAVGRLQMMEPTQVRAALKQQWAKNLSAPVRAELLRKAKKAEEAAMEEAMEAQAVGHVDRLMDMRSAGVSDSDIQKELRRLPAKYRKEVESRLVYSMNLEDKMETETQTDYLKKYLADAALGELANTNLKELPEWDLMDPGTQMSIIRAKDSSAKGTKAATSIETYDEILDLYGKGKRGEEGAWKDLRKALNKAASEGRISPSDYEQYTKISQDGEVPEEVGYELTDKEAIAWRISGSSDADKRREMLGYMGEWHRRYKARNNGKEPSERERNEAIDQALLEYEYAKGGGFWGYSILNDPEMPVYKMTIEQRAEAVNIIRREEPVIYQTAIRALADSGVVNPTDAQILHASRLASGD